MYVSSLQVQQTADGDVVNFQIRDSPGEDPPPFDAGDDNFRGGEQPQQRHLQQHRHLGYHEMDCSINKERTIKCRKEGNEVFLPFTFIKSYFEVSRLLLIKGF